MQLSSGKLEDAIKTLSSIDPTSNDYTKKIELLARFHLVRREGLEAWRTLQVGRRVRRAKNDWNDLERLAIFQARSCPLALEPSEDGKARAHLLNAAVYRLLPAIFRDDSSTFDRAEPGETHLTAGLVPYLKEIPQTQLLQGQGCRLAKTIVNQNSLRKSELKALLDYLDSGERSEGAGARLLILARALELAVTDPESTKRIEAMIPPPSEIAWAELPDAERQWLFVHSFGGRSLTDVPVQRQPEAQRLAISILNTEEASPLWIAMIDLDSLSLKTRLDLLTRLAAKDGPFKGRAWILFDLARAKYESGQTIETLTILRRLLVEREEVIDDAMEDAGVTLASHIFIEYRFDQKIFGALDASLPSRLWRTLLTRAAMRSALAGRPTDLQSIEKLAARRNSTLDLSLLKPLARRNLKAFEKELHDMNPEFARTLASYMVDESFTKTLVPYANAVAKRLRAQSTGPNQDIDDLTRLLSRPESEWAKGNASVRQGVLRVGVARRPRLDVAPFEFALEPPATLAKRDLFFIPDLQMDGGWTFSTAKR